MPTASETVRRDGLTRLAAVLQGSAVSTGDALGGDPIASHLRALRQLVADRPAALSLVDGLVSYLDPDHPAARARRVSEYQNTDHGTPIPHEVLYPPPNYTVSEVAARLGVSRWWVLRRLQDGTIPGYRLGREWRIKQATLDSLIDGGAA